MWAEMPVTVQLIIQDSQPHVLQYHVKWGFRRYYLAIEPCICYIAQTGHDLLKIPLPLSPKWWKYRDSSSHLISNSRLKVHITPFIKIYSLAPSLSEPITNDWVLSQIADVWAERKLFFYATKCVVLHFLVLTSW